MKLSEEKEKWLEVRRKAISDYFDVPQSEQAKVDAVFADMERLADGCANQAEFERQLLNSPVNTAYNGLYSSLSQYVRVPQGPSFGSVETEVVTGMLGSVIKQQARNKFVGWLVNLLPSWLTDWWIYRAHNIPGVGRVIGAKNTYDQFGGRVMRAQQAAREQERLQKSLDEQKKQMQEQQEAYEQLVKERQEAAQKEMDKYK